MVPQKNSYDTAMINQQKKPCRAGIGTQTQHPSCASFRKVQPGPQKGMQRSQAVIIHKRKIFETFSSLLKINNSHFFYFS